MKLRFKHFDGRRMARVDVTVVGDFNKTRCLDWMSNSADYMPIGAPAMRAYRLFALV
jgi:hypothetical protein